MSAWKVVVDYCLPPPLILIILMSIPAPHVIKKGLVKFTKTILFTPTVANIRLVHVMLVVTGIAFLNTAYHTYSITVAASDDTLTPNQRTGQLARKWREERNFWIAGITFLLWFLVNKFYNMLDESTVLQDRVWSMQRQLKSLGQEEIDYALEDKKNKQAKAGGSKQKGQ